MGNIINDVYLNLDSRTEKFEIDKNGVKWLDLKFDAEGHHFFSRTSSLGGSAISFAVLNRMGLLATISGSNLKMSEDGLISDTPAESFRYILLSDGQVSYFVPSEPKVSTFVSPTEPVDYIYIDRSARLDLKTIKELNVYLDLSKDTKLILYVYDAKKQNLNELIPRANLIFYENNENNPNFKKIPELENPESKNIIFISENRLTYKDVVEPLSPKRIDVLTHLSFYSIVSSTTLGCFILGYSVEDSLKMARLNAENSRLDSTLSLETLKSLFENPNPEENIEFIAANLVLRPKGILAADESGGSIKKKFEQLNIEDTYNNRRDYRNIFFTTPDLEKYVNGVILFDETARQFADNGQTFVNFLISRRVIPGIKVDQGLEPFENSPETYTKGLDGLNERLKEYHNLGLRFAKWRSAFEIKLNASGETLTPSAKAIEKNCHDLAEYAFECQSAGLVPIVEPEVVYDGYYPIEKNAEITGKILDQLFKSLAEKKVNLKACVLKVNMVLAGKNYETQSTPEEVGRETAKVLKEHIPEELAGVVFLSGGQTPEQATENLAEVLKNGPFPYPVTFSFARALQDPALYAWVGNNENAEKARQAFLDRLIANSKAIQP